MRGGGAQEEHVQPNIKKKKMKADRNSNTISLDSVDVQLMTKTVTKETQTSFKSKEEVTRRTFRYSH